MHDISMDVKKIIMKKQKHPNTNTYPASKFNSVLFPAPLGPIMAVNWPDRKAPFNPCKISFFSVNVHASTFNIRWEKKQ